MNQPDSTDRFTPIGEDRLGELARSQIHSTRIDPCLERSGGAAIVDFWAALEEAERTRLLGIWGLREVAQALEREEARIGVTRDTAKREDQLQILQAAWERAELARLELANEHPHLNAGALISLNSALDALVEELAPPLRALRIDLLAQEVFERAEQREPEAANELSADVRDALQTAVRATLDKTIVPKLPRLTGSGVERYERLLADVGLGAPADRAIPDELNEALTELGALRDVLIHRAGRVDGRALDQAPSLRYADGELVRIKNAAYRKYSAAVRCYANEILFRGIRSWPEVSDADGPDLERWRDYSLVTA